MYSKLPFKMLSQVLYTALFFCIQSYIISMYKTHIKYEEYNSNRAWKLKNLGTPLFRRLQVSEDSNLLFFL